MVSPFDGPSPPLEEPRRELRLGTFVVSTLNGKTCQPMDAFGPAAGLKRVAYSVRVDNKGEEALHLSPFDFKLRLSQGASVRATLGACPAAGNRAPAALEAGDLRAGTSIEGWLLFDIAEGREPTSMTFTPFVVGQRPLRGHLELPTLH